MTTSTPSPLTRARLTLDAAEGLRLDLLTGTPHGALLPLLLHMIAEAEKGNEDLTTGSAALRAVLSACLGGDA